MQDTHDVMPVNALIPQKLKPKTIRLRRYLSRAYPLKKDEVETKKNLWVAPSGTIICQ